jgi:hypothetical protein
VNKIFKKYSKTENSEGAEVNETAVSSDFFKFFSRLPRSRTQDCRGRKKIMPAIIYRRKK